MATVEFTDADIPKEGFTDKDLQQIGPKSPFERAGQFYRDITAQPREDIAAGISSILHPLTPTPKFPRMEGGLLPSSENVRKYNEAVQAMPKSQPPGGLARFGAGVVLPPEFWEFALQRVAPGIGTFFRTAKPTVGPISQAVSGTLKRAGVTSAATGAAAALTGENPIIPAAAGAGTSVLSDIIRGVVGHTRRDLIPESPEGWNIARERFAPDIDLSKPQPDSILRAIVEDMPILKKFITRFDQLQDFVTDMSGRHVVKNPPLVKRIGERIYQPLHTLLDKVSPDHTFDFPYLSPSRLKLYYPPPSTSTVLSPDVRAPITDATISEILPGIYEKILRKAGRLNAEDTLDVIHQLKSVAFSGVEDAIKGAAQKLVTTLEDDFVNQLGKIHRVLPLVYRSSNQSYAQLKQLQRFISDDPKQLFQRGPGNRLGLDPAAWDEVLLEKSYLMPRTTINHTTGNEIPAWSKFRDTIDRIGAVRRAAPRGEGRLYEEVPGLRSARWGVPFYKPHPKIEAFTTTPKPLSPLFQALLPSTISGLHSWGLTPQQQAEEINRRVNPWSK